MEPVYQFLPNPRQLKWGKGRHELAQSKHIRLEHPEPQALSFSAGRLQQALRCHLGLDWGIIASWASPKNAVGVTLRLNRDELRYPQQYSLKIKPSQIVIEGHDEAGIFYGICTLVQLITQAGSRDLPCLEILDWPDIPARGVMLDISRDKVPHMKTLYDLIDRLASWKINQVQLYTEHTFAFLNHPEVWASASPMTGEEILALDAYCKQRYMELVPNLNCFGHMGRWLKFPRYAPLAEIHGEFPVPWGTMHGPFSLSPVNPGSLELVRGLLDEMLPHFSSRTVNVGCDETFDIGHGQSKAICEEKGTHRVYLDYVLNIHADLARRGYHMQFWGDIINEAPDLIPEIPADVTGLIWGYEADHPFKEQAARFQAAGVRFYVCPGTSSWNSIAGRTDNALGNLLNAAENGIQYGAAGYLITDWGDNGHWQVYPVSFLGFMAGAAYSWCLPVNRKVDVADALSRFAFDDPSGVMGKFVYDLGNVYQAPGIVLHNSSTLFHLLQLPLQELVEREVSKDVFENSLAAIDAVASMLGQDKMRRADADLIRREFTHTIHMLRFGCRRGLLACEKDPVQKDRLREELTDDLKFLTAEYASVWLERNRAGGLKDSLARFQGV